MSSSGPLSLAFTYSRPIALSQELLAYTKSYDFMETMAECQIRSDDLFFSFRDNSFSEFLGKMDLQKYKKLSEFSGKMAIKRSFNNIGRIYQDVIL